MHEHLLGFDVRELWLDPGVAWGAERRALFLLVPDVVRPLSLDMSVWASAFDLLDIPRPTWVGANADLWEDLGRMERCLGAEWLQPDRPHAVIAVTWVATDAAQRVGGPYGPYAEPTVPPTLNPVWERLGFDVADAATSGLTNCGYQGTEVEDLRARFGPALNGHHLFATVSPALEFRAHADGRIPEHAPFHVFGLYRIHPAGLSARRRVPTAAGEPIVTS